MKEKKIKYFLPLAWRWLISVPLLLIGMFGIRESMAQGNPIITIVAPNDLSGTGGNTGARAPFGDFQGSVRYQQVFNASQFARIQDGGGFITSMGFRLSSEFSGGQVDIDTLQINFSTTGKTPDSLSPIFAENVGFDDRLVFGPAFLRLADDPIPGSDPQPFGIFVSFHTPFYYDPNMGNLLMDIRKYSQTLPGAPVLDGENTLGDSVSRILAFDVNATTGTATSFGFVSTFVITPVQEPGTWALLGLALLAIFARGTFSKLPHR